MNKNYVYLLLLLFNTGLMADPLESGFSYQGQLTDNNVPADGSYDFELELYDAASGGAQVGVTINVDDVNVVEGLFSIELDFGTLPYMGDQLWVLTKVRDGASVGGFTELLPLQKLTAVPYAIHAEFVASGSVGAGEIDDNQVQRRVTGSCPAGQIMTAVNADGTVQCAVDAGLTSVSSSDIIDGTISQNDMGNDSVGSDQLSELESYEVGGVKINGDGLEINSIFDIVIKDDVNGFRWRTSDDSAEMANITVSTTNVSFSDTNQKRNVFLSNSSGLGLGGANPTVSHDVTVSSLNVTGNIEIGLERVTTTYALDTTTPQCHSHGN